MAIYSPYGRIITGGYALAGPLAENTLSLLHLNGIDASTTFTDQVAGMSWSGNGTPELDTAQQKFGSASLFLPATNDFISTANLSDISTGDWTVEYFVRFNNDIENIAVINVYDSAFGNSIALTIQNDVNSKRLIVYDPSVSELLNISETTTAVEAITWYHIAGVKEGTTYSVYYDGNRVATITEAGTMNDTGPSGNIEILTTSATDIWIDEFRISRVARYSGTTYTIPSTEFVVD